METGFLSGLSEELTSGWAYLLKQSVPDLDTVIRAINGAIHGMVVLDPELVKALSKKVDSPIAQLPRRHQQILELIAQGYTNAAIGQRLSLAEKTIETYLTYIYRELELSEEPDIHLRVKAATLYLQDT
jgi:DNA-binding NarL/FixJ family response regulator